MSFPRDWAFRFRISVIASSCLPGPPPPHHLTFGGTLKDIPAVELGPTAINAALQRSGLQPDEIGTVVMGNTVQAGNKMNPARQAAIHGGLPVQVPAMTVNRVCGSGAQAIVSAAHEILIGSVVRAWSMCAGRRIIPKLRERSNAGTRL